MIRSSFILFGSLCFVVPAFSQSLKKADVPLVVRNALIQKYPAAHHVVWEKEKGNYEANWGGKSNEDSSAAFTPKGEFVEIVVAIPVSGLPAGVVDYVKKNYPGVRITEAGKITDVDGKTGYEAEVKGKDMIFDAEGSFVRKD